MNRIVIVILTLIFVSGCASTQNKNQQGAVAQIDDSLATLPDKTFQPKSYNGFCKKVVNELSNSNVDYLITHLEMEDLLSLEEIRAIIREAFSSFSADPKQSEALVVQIVNLFKQRYLEAIKTNLTSEVNFYYINVDDEKRCVIHSEFDDYGFSMFELGLDLKEGKYRVVDFYDYMMSSRASVDLPHYLGELYNEKSEDGVFDLNNTPMLLYTRAVNSGDADAAWKYLNQTPKKYLEFSSYYNHFLQLLIKTDEQKYNEVLGLYNKNIPLERQGLVAYDYHVLEKDIDSALLLIKGVEEKTASDPLFDLLRALAYRDVGKKKEFLAHIKRAIEYGSEYDDAYWVLVEFFVGEKRFEDAVLVLDVLKQKVGYEFERKHFKNDDLYKELYRSEAFNRWIDS